MQHSFKLFVLLFTLSIQGCETLSEYRPPINVSKASNEQDQLQRLFRQSKRYHELSKKQRQAACKRLKQDYNKKADWQIAWLLVYSLNDEFNCIKLSRSLKLLKEIKSTLDSSSQLVWLNNTQILLLEGLVKYKSKNKFLRSLLKKSQAQLTQSQEELIQTQEDLQKENSKIEALKAIETNINKKLENE